MEEKSPTSCLSFISGFFWGVEVTTEVVKADSLFEVLDNRGIFVGRERAYKFFPQSSTYSESWANLTVTTVCYIFFLWRPVHLPYSSPLFFSTTPKHLYNPQSFKVSFQKFQTILPICVKIILDASRMLSPNTPISQELWSPFFLMRVGDMLHLWPPAF